MVWEQEYPPLIRNGPPINLLPQRSRFTPHYLQCATGLDCQHFCSAVSMLWCFVSRRDIERSGSLSHSVCSLLLSLLLLQQCGGSVWDIQCYSVSLLTVNPWMTPRPWPESSHPHAVTTHSWLVPTAALWPFCVPTTTCSSLTPQSHSALELPAHRAKSLQLYPVGYSPGEIILSRLLPGFPGTGSALAGAIQWTSTPPIGYNHTFSNKAGNPSWGRGHSLPSLSFLKYPSSVRTRAPFFFFWVLFKVKVKSLSRVWLFATPRIVAHGIFQARVLAWV